MFETLEKATLDKIFVLMAEYAADPRDGKIDLGVGVYKDPKNNTPIMTAVKKAEQRILDSAKTKTYKGVVGNKEFSAAIVDLALAGVVDQSRIRCVNGAGGTGALMILMHVLGRARPGGRIFLSDPSWPNHWPLAENANLVPHTYPVLRSRDPQVEFRGHDGGARQPDQGRHRPAARLLPQPDRRQPHAGAVGHGRREPQAHRRVPAGRSRLSRLRRRHRRGRLWHPRGGDGGAGVHDRVLGEQEFRALSRARRRRHRDRQGRGDRRCRLEPDAEHHPRHDLARRRTTAPKSSASSSRTRSCAPSGRPSSRKCGNG